MAVTYSRLYCPTTQFQLKNGAINVAGLLKVKLEGTDDYAPVFDEDGTQLAQPVILDNNGRSKGLFVDSAKVYWLEVDDRDGYELFTIRKMTPCGGGGGSSIGGKYEVVSSDGTVSVEAYDDGGVTVFDLSTAVTSQAATWGATFATANAVSGDDNWEILPVVTSAGTSQWSNGWTASKDCVADIAASLEMDGDSSAISTVDVMCVFSVDGTGVSTEYSQLDPSDSRGKVSFEYKGELLEGQVVDCRIFVKSVEAMAPALVAKAYFNEECDGIIGGGGEGGGEYHAGDYVEITGDRVINVTGLQPQSAMSSYVQQSAFSSLSSVVSSVQGDTAYISSVVSGITGDFTGYIPYSALSGSGAKITGISGSAIGGTDYSAGEYVDISGNTISVTGLQPVSGMSSYVEKSAISAESSKWNEVSGLSGKLDNSASSTWYPWAGNPSGFLTAHQELTGYVEKSSISAESSTWNSASAISAVIPWSALEGTGSTITAISGSAVGSTSTGGKTYTGIDPVVVDNTADTISVKHSGLTVDGTMTAYTSGTDIVIGVKTSEFVPASGISAQSSTWDEVSAKIPWSALETDGTAITAISGSAIGGGATGDYVEKSATNVTIGSSNNATYSSFAQGVDNTAVTWSFAQGKNNIANASSFAQGADVVSWNESFSQGRGTHAKNQSFSQGDNAKAYNSSFAVGRNLNAYSGLTAFGRNNRKQSGTQGIAFLIGDGTASNNRHDLFLIGTDGEITTFSSTSDTTGFAFRSAILAKLDGSATAGFYSTSNPSGFITGVDLTGYATTGYVESSVSGKLDKTAFNSGDFYSTSNPSGFITGVDLTPYQEKSGMTAYQGAGDYAYNSSLADYIPTSESSKYVTSLAGYATEGYVDSAVSGKLDKTAFNSGDFYSTANPSGFITGVDLTPYQEKTGMSGYIPTSESGSYQQVSAMTAYQPVGEYYSASNPSGFITGVDLSNYATTGYVDSSVSGKQDASGMTAYQPVSGMTAYQPSGDYAYNSAVSGKADSSALTAYQEITGMTAYQPSGDYAFNSALSSKLDASASASFQPSGNYQPSGDYAYNSALTAYQPVSGMTAYAPSGDYADNSALGLKQDASAMTAYQEVSGMTAYQPAGDYQPSGDYIYASSLGIMEI